MEGADMPKRYVQQWLPGFEPAKPEQPSLPGFGDEDEMEPSAGDLQ